MDIENFNVNYGALVRFKANGEDKLLQFLDSQDGLQFNFYVKGNTVKTIVYDENQFKYKKYMAPNKKVDMSKKVISPMPGAIVSISVEIG